MTEQQKADQAAAIRQGMANMTEQQKADRAAAIKSKKAKVDAYLHIVSAHGQLDVAIREGDKVKCTHLSCPCKGKLFKVTTSDVKWNKANRGGAAYLGHRSQCPGHNARIAAANAKRG